MMRRSAHRRGGSARLAGGRAAEWRGRKAGVRRPALAALVLAGALGVVGASAARAEGERLSLYCSNLEEQCREIAAGFERKTGIAVAMIRKSTGEFYAQMKVEAANPQGDVWWGGPVDSHEAANQDGLLQAYASPAVADLQPWAQDEARRSGDRTNAVYAGAIGIGYNEDILKARGLPPPRCWDDLTQPAYRGEIQIANPAASGTAYLFLAMTLERLGEEAGFAYLRAVHPNINQYARSGDAPVKALALGETGIGIAFLHGMTQRFVQGAPVRTIIPCEGTGYEMIGMSIIRSAKNPRAAQAFVDYALSKEAQDMNAALGVAAVPARRDARLAPETPDLSHIRLIAIDGAKYAAPAERARLLKRFETEVRSSAR